LPKLVNGERVAAIAMSEPGAGSDLQSIRTTAKRDGDGYRINGSKTFISNGQIADLIIVVAKTDPTAGHKGVSLIVLETDGLKGFQRGKKLDKIGLEAQDTSELFFNDVWVPQQNLLGAQEGKGFYQLMAELPRERLLLAISGVVTMELALETHPIRQGSQGLRPAHHGFSEHAVQACRMQGAGHGGQGLRQ
jgi:alkylation response protein AidB-like acyl-CoA dehydrogenase